MDEPRNTERDFVACSRVSQEERHGLLKQNPTTLWLTGLSAAGKSTLAFALERELVNLGHACFVLDGDKVRHGLNRDLSYSTEDRSENIRRIAEVARLMNDAGLIVIVAVIAPLIRDREMARELIGTAIYREVYVSTSLSVCEARDPKGLYAKARKGELLGFTGISSPYQEPHSPDLIIDTSELSVAQALTQLLPLVLTPSPNGL